MEDQENKQGSDGVSEGTPGPVTAVSPGIERMTWNANLASFRDKSAVQFPTKEALREALSLFWHDKSFFGVPRYYVGNWTIIVPTAVVDGLRGKGLSFTVQKVASPGQIAAETMNKLRAGQGPR